MRAGDVRVVIVAGWLAGCGAPAAPATGAAPGPVRAAGNPGAPAATPSTNTSRVIDGAGPCPYTSENGPEHDRVFAGCHVFAPMEDQFPFIACTEAKACLHPCRRSTIDYDGEVSYAADFRYDSAGRLVESVTKDHTGGIADRTTYTYDSPALWHIETSTLLGTISSTIKLDAAGRVIERVRRSSSRFTPPTTVTLRFSYDASGKLATEDVTAENNGKPETQSIPYTYDAQGRLLTREQPAIHDSEFRYAYGDDGKVATVEYHGIRWGLVHDAAGRLVELQEDGRPRSRYVYDAQGRLTEVQEVNGAKSRVAVRYEYDCMPTR